MWTHVKPRLKGNNPKDILDFDVLVYKKREREEERGRHKWGGVRT